jgi:hypothetical protein
MPVIVVTRLRLRDPALLDEFFTDAVAAIEQAMKSDGNLPDYSLGLPSLLVIRPGRASAVQRKPHSNAKTGPVRVVDLLEACGYKAQAA